MNIDQLTQLFAQLCVVDDEGIEGKNLAFQSMQVHAEVLDFATKVTLTHVFRNSTSNVIEYAKYMLPMESKAAVTGFKITVNENVFQGVVMEKEQVVQILSTEAVLHLKGEERLTNTESDFGAQRAKKTGRPRGAAGPKGLRRGCL